MSPLIINNTFKKIPLKAFQEGDQGLDWIEEGDQMLYQTPPPTESIDIFWLVVIIFILVTIGYLVFKALKPKLTSKRKNNRN